MAKASDGLHCVVVTPETTQFDEAVDFVALPLFDGELGVLPGRAPLIGRLGYGVLRTVTDGTTRRYFLDGGFAQVRDDVVTVLTSRALPVELINPHTADEELTRALSLPGATELERAERDRALERARSLVRIASHPA